MRLAQKAAATEDRDREYGLLGILNTDISTKITPDYSLSTRAVYVNFAKTLVESTGGLSGKGPQSLGDRQKKTRILSFHGRIWTS